MKRFPIYLLFMLAFTYGCTDSDSSIGEQLVSNSFINVYTDTCTVRLSTVRIDSMATSGKEVALVGRFSHPITGVMEATSYISYLNTYFSPTEAITYRFDSLTLELDHTGAYWGDTLSILNLRIHELLAPVELDDDGYCYNVNSLPYNPEILASASLRFSTGSKKKIEIRLPDEMGRKWFDKLIDINDTDLREEEKFKHFFPGLAFVSDQNSQLISSFSIHDSSMAINLYYRELTDFASESRLSFSPSSTLHYNRMNHQKENTPLAGFDYEKEQRSDLTDNLAFVSGLPGYYTKIEIPYLNDLMENGEKIVISSASLLLYPEPGTYESTTPLSPSLLLYVADENDVTQSELSDLYGVEVQTGSLQLDDYYKRDTYYTFDLTDFLSDQLGKFGRYKQHLQLVLPSDTISSSFNTVIFRDNSQEDLSTKLLLKYQIYKPH